MQLEEGLNILVRFAHVLSAIGLLGGAIFFLVVMRPSLSVVDEGLRGSIVQVARKRFYRITHPALLLLILSGFYNYWRNLEVYARAPKAVHMLLGFKILLALAITAIIFGQSFGAIKGCPARWTRINVAMGLAIVALAAVVRQMRLGALVLSQ